MKNLFYFSTKCYAAVLLFFCVVTTAIHAQNNNMGVGTTTPNASAILDVYSNTKGLLIPRPSTAPASPAAGLMYYGGGRVNYFDGSVWRPTGLWSLNGNNAYYSDGNVGIGISNPLYTLHVQNAGGYGLVHSAAGVALATYIDASGGWFGTKSNHPLHFYTNDSSPLMSISTQGNVGLGTTSPLSKLSISPSAAEAKITLWDGGNSATHLGFGVSNGQLNYDVPTGNHHVFYAGGKNGTGTELMRINGDGVLRLYNRINVNHGNDTNAGEFQNNSLSYPSVYARNINSDGFAFYAFNGRAAKPGGGAWEVVSDLRLKKDIESYGEGLELIRKVRPVSFYYNGTLDLPTHTRYVGVIAQELQEISPSMVSVNKVQDSPENYLMVDPSAFTYMLINSVKELDETVKKQQQTIEAQQAEIDAIKTALAKAGIKLD